MTKSSSNLSSICDLSSKSDQQIDLFASKPSLSNPESDTSIASNKKKRLSADGEPTEPSKKLTKPKTKLTKAKTETDLTDPSSITSKDFTLMERVHLTGTDTEAKLYEALKKFYGYDKFKSETQRKAVFEVSKRRGDVYVSMPTGRVCFFCYL